MTNALYYGDNLAALREHIKDESCGVCNLNLGIVLSFSAAMVKYSEAIFPIALIKLPTVKLQFLKMRPIAFNMTCLSGFHTQAL